MGHLGEASVHLHLLDGVDQCAKGPLLHQLLPHHLGPDHDVRVAEGVLGVTGRACARLGAPVPQTPAAQEHDKPEPGSHCRCRCRAAFASPKLRYTPLAGSLQPELARPAVWSNFGFGYAALRVPSGTGWGEARLPRRWHTIRRVGSHSGRRSGSCSKSWRSPRSRRRRSCQIGRAHV